MKFDILQTNPETSSNSLSSERPGQDMNDSSNDSIVKDLGQINTMKLPDGFKLGEHTSGSIGTRMFKEYHSDEDPDVQYHFYYRGMRTTDGSARAFKEVLQSPAHVLKQSEINTLGETLDVMAVSKEFKIMIAKTQDLNGKRVLSVEGEFLNQKVMTRTLYIDADGTGSAVQEISFQAPTDRFMKNIPRASKVFDSIIWI